MFELRKNRGVIFHETEKGYKIWRGINLSFQNWRKEFDRFWPEHSKVPKIFTLIVSFWAKYILFELKKYRGVIFDETEEGYKIWRGINLLFQDWRKEFDKFWPEHSKVSNIFTLIVSFWAKYIVFELKKDRGVIFHEIEKGYKIWRGIDLSLQDWRKEFDKFWPEHSKVSKIFTLIGSFWVNYVLFELTKYRGVIFHETGRGYKIWRGIDLSFQNWHKEFDKFWPEHSKVSKIFTLMGSFWAKYILSELKKIERSYLSWHWRVMQNLKKNWLVFTRALESVKIGTLMGFFCPR